MEKGVIIGHLGKDAEIKDIAGYRVIEFSVACTKKVKGEKATTWYKVQKWLGEKDTGAIANYLKKGTQVYVEGELSCRTWVKDGQANYEMQIKSEKIELLGGGKGENQTPQAELTNGEYNPKDRPVDPPTGADDLPF